MKMIIEEYWSGKRHTRTLKHGSYRYEVEGKYLVVRNYYTGKTIHKFDVSKYGSIRFWVEY